MAMDKDQEQIIQSYFAVKAQADTVNAATEAKVAPEMATLRKIKTARSEKKKEKKEKDYANYNMWVAANSNKYRSLTAARKAASKQFDVSYDTILRAQRAR